MDTGLAFTGLTQTGDAGWINKQEMTHTGNRYNSNGVTNLSASQKYSPYGE
jgi:hypothetical protein